MDPERWMALGWRRSVPGRRKRAPEARCGAWVPRKGLAVPGTRQWLARVGHRPRCWTQAGRASRPGPSPITLT